MSDNNTQQAASAAVGTGTSPEVDREMAAIKAAGLELVAAVYAAEKGREKPLPGFYSPTLTGQANFFGCF